MFPLWHAVPAREDTAGENSIYQIVYKRTLSEKLSPAFL